MLFYFIFFSLGSIIGSFLNVVIYRADLEKSALSGKSYCPFCKKQLKWWELIPILSFFILKGHCFVCKEKISWQYPMVEFITGLFFVLIFWRFERFAFFNLIIEQNFNIETLFFILSFLFWIYWLSVLIIISVYDIHKYLILNNILFPAIILTIFWFIIFNLAVIFFDFRFLNNHLNLFEGVDFVYHLLGNVPFWKSSLLGGIVAGGVIGLIVFLSKGKAMGWGDPPLAFFLGLILGWPGALFFLIITFLLSGLVALFLVFLRKKTLKSFVPFAPLLSLGAVLIFLFGDIIVKWYFDLFNYL